MLRRSKRSHVAPDAPMSHCGVIAEIIRIYLQNPV